ncbi:hypothetical protein NXU87_03395 [Candidatus Bacteroides intestinigallinarum]|jgi:hypothetical protein|uniref:hypothetical protein n=1 Tax=Bacteroides TaxID=816 RepID=UPI000E9127B1|nr:MULTISPECIES: hypothetical protein [Bacteroides]MCS3175151.1 hypothetical protein [Candidatus Bacteroides intestinigallinarum]RGN52552.1 hypothetical protein DXB58_26880 [Bacteroides sp. OM05-10AA]RGQ56517.1 hypothetical protein DWY87_26915 [Bacteroides sp. AF27-33]
MEKIIFIGGIGSGKTYLTEAIISQNGGVILHPMLKKQLILQAVEICKQIAFDGFTEHRLIKKILSEDTFCYLTHVLCTFQSRPKWLTPMFVKKHHIKVFEICRPPCIAIKHGQKRTNL